MTATRTTAELLDASEHIHYDFSMAIGLSRHLARVKPLIHEEGGNEHLSMVSNAMIATTAMAVRSLLGFAYERGVSKSKDIFASHFAKNWETVRPLLSPDLEEVAARADKEVAHLSFGRAMLDSGKRGWRFLPIYNALVPINNAFIQHADKALLRRPLWEATLTDAPLDLMPEDRTLMDFWDFAGTFSSRPGAWK